MSIGFTADGERGFFAGDVMHHPIQVTHPEWSSIFSDDPVRGEASRRWALDLAAREDMLVFTSISRTLRPIGSATREPGTAGSSKGERTLDVRLPMPPTNKPSRLTRDMAASTVPTLASMSRFGDEAR